jgi:hypothetical protein
MLNLRKTTTRLVVMLFVLDITFLVLHSVFGWSLVNLDEEGNLTAWYSSVKLLLLFALCLVIYNHERMPGRAVAFKWNWLWVLVALIYLFLSADETASIHERTARMIMEESSMGLDIRETVLGGDRMKDSFAWVLLLAPFILAVAVFFLLFFFNRFKKCRPVLVTSLVALGMYLAAVGLESTIYAFPSFAEWSEEETTLYKVYLAIEESMEMLGTTLFVYAFLRYIRFVQEEI